MENFEKYNKYIFLKSSKKGIYLINKYIFLKSSKKGFTDKK